MVVLAYKKYRALPILRLFTPAAFATSPVEQRRLPAHISHAVVAELVDAQR
ncbi:MAG: hypothetical protein WBC71_06400 [Salaquimonas sp.]